MRKFLYNSFNSINWVPTLAFVLMIAYWPGIEAPATTLRWCLLYAFFPLVIYKWNVDFEKVFIYASYGIAINSLISIGQWFRWDLAIDGHGYYNTDIAYWIVNLSWRPAGLFVNGNILAETTALMIVGCITYRKWFHVLLMIPAMVLPMQRASMLALLIAGMIYYRKYIIYILLMIIVGIFLILWLRGLDIESFKDRIDLWSFALSNLNWFGNGVSSFRNDYLNYSGFTDTSYNVIYVHNDYLELIYDLGIFGIIPISIFAFTLFSNCKIKYVLWAFAVIAFFGFPSHMPVTLFILALCIIECLRNWSDNSLSFWCSRIFTFAGNVQQQFIST